MKCCEKIVVVWYNGPVYVLNVLLKCYLMTIWAREWTEVAPYFHNCG
jgi:hypothetical protein